MYRFRSDQFSGTLFECIGSYLDNGMTNVGLQMLNCCCFVGITLMFNGEPQKIVQRFEILASWRSINITIFKWPSNKSIVAWDVWQVVPSYWTPTTYTTCLLWLWRLRGPCFQWNVVKLCLRSTSRTKQSFLMGALTSVRIHVVFLSPKYLVLAY